MKSLPGDTFPSQIGIFTQIRIGFKDAARERPVLIIDEGKLQQRKCLRIGSMVAYRGAQRYDARGAEDPHAYRTIRYSAIGDAVAGK